MTATLTIRADGQDDAERKLFLLAKRFGNLTPLMGRIGIVLETSTIERFDTESAPDGAKWKPSIRAKEEGGKTLTDRAILKNSITHVASASSAQVGTNVIYAGAHQEGIEKTVTVPEHKRRMTQAFGRQLRTPIEVIVGSFQRAMKLPARKFLGLSADDREEIEAQIVDYVADVDPDVQP